MLIMRGMTSVVKGADVANGGAVFRGGFCGSCCDGGGGINGGNGFGGGGLGIRRLITYWYI